MSKFSEEVENLRKSRRDKEDAQRVKETHPSGFEPGLHMDGGQGTLTYRSTERVTSKNAWAAHLEYFGFNPDEFVVDNDVIEYRCWEGPDGQGGKQLYHYYKVKIRLKDFNPTNFDFDWFKAYVTEKVTTPKKSKTQKVSMVLALSDWQLGKQDGDGTEGTIRRVNESIVQFKEHVSNLKKYGLKFDRLIICGLGDIVEGCDGHYAMQSYSVQLNQRDQITVATALIVKIIKEVAPLFPFITVAVVGGNHGENRKNGKSFTDLGDNWDNLAFDQASKILEENKQLSKKISWNIADKDLTMTLDVHGKILGIAHGHQFRTGGQSHSQKAGNWLAKQALARTAIGGSDILLSAHFHHLSVEHQRNTTLIQTPALDGGSLWIENSHALTSEPGVLTFTIDSNGADNIKVLRGEIIK